MNLIGIFVATTFAITGWMLGRWVALELTNGDRR